MSATNIVVARFGTTKNTQTRNLWQYDYGQILQFVGLDLPAAYIVHFSNCQFSGEAKTMIGNEDGVDIPDEYLETGATVYAWIYLHAGEDDGETVYMVTIPVKARPRPTEDEPTPVQQGVIDAAIAALNSGVAEVEQIANDIPQTIDDALQEAKDSGEFDGEDGYTPIKGVDYFDGEDGYTPIKGVDYFDGTDGRDGEDGYTPIKGVDYFDGEDGEDGYTPIKGVDYFDGEDGEDGATFTPSVSQEGIISWTNNKGLPNPQSVDIMGPPGPRGEPGTGVSAHICSSSEYDPTTRVPTIQDPDENTFYLVPAEDAASPNMFVEWIFTNNAWELFGSATVEVPVQDVKVNGVSVLGQDGVANVPVANSSTPGVMKVSQGTYGLTVNNGELYSSPAQDDHIKAGTNAYRCISPRRQDQSVFYGLAKAAGDSTQAASSNPVGMYTDDAKAAIQQMLDVPSNDDIPTVPVQSVNGQTGAVVLDAADVGAGTYSKPSGGIPASDLAAGVIPTVPVQDVQVNGVSVLGQDGVANVPVASNFTLGAIKTAAGNGILVTGAGNIYIAKATDAHVKSGSSSFLPIVTDNQHISTFYGLAKAAGDTTQSSSSNTVGNYTDAAKVAIQKMLGIYEAPWELIREDTVTNATEADIEITADGNGQSFELTDVYLQVWTPQQETGASIGDYGTVRNYYSDSGFITSQMQTWEQASGASAKYGQVLLKNENGAVINVVTQNNSQYALVGLVGRTNMIANDALVKIGTYAFSKTVIKKVTGTINYRLYGRRKWN